MKELKDYTDKELRDELNKRAENRWSPNRKERKPYYTYTTAEVKSVRINQHGRSMNKYEFIMTEDLGYHREFYEGYVVGPYYGFNRTNIPKIGDTVTMRKRIYVDPSHDRLGEWKICNIERRM